MTQLTEHFSEEELDVQSADERVKLNAQHLCRTLLEPIHGYFRCPIVITSGYRPPEHNAEVGGVKSSEHQYEDDHAAVDLALEDVPLTHAFNWIRLLSGLDFRQVILEYDKHDTPRCIHISTRRGGNDKREALIGMTHGQGGYTHVDVGPKV